ncbi:DNA-formamidopyrimidine glycosylase family protein [Thalassiella azotivora]
MPEGDVVLRTARRLHSALAGGELVHCDLRWPSLATVDLTGWRVTEVRSVGKHLLTRMTPPLHRPDEPPVTLHSHLRMEGSWHVHRTGRGWGADGPRRPEDGVRAVLATAVWTAVGHRLGVLELVRTDAEADVVGHLGPDVLAEDWEDRGRRTALANLAGQPDRAVGEALLDQRNLAGIGTYYMAESLFVRGVSPWAPVRDVDLGAVVDVARRMLGVNADRPVQATTGDLRPGRTSWVHPRAGRPCRRCGTPVRVDPIGAAPQDRVAFHCPRCQPVPAGWQPQPTPAAAPTRRRGPRGPGGYAPRG